MVNYFVCPCIFDIFLVSNPKEINELVKSNFLEVSYLILLDAESNMESNLYICCKENIVFHYECHSRSDIFKTCGDISDSVNCFDLLSFGFKNICSKCKKLILKYFLDILIKVKK